MYQIFYVDKTTNTPADNLLAFGLAKLLIEITSNKQLGLSIIDDGDCYRISLEKSFNPAWIDDVSFFSLFRGLNTGKKIANLPTEHTIDYQNVQRQNQEYFDARKKTKDDEILRESGFRPPPTQWDAWVMLNQMSALDTYNNLAEIWYEHRKCFPQLLNIILVMFSTRPNQVDEGEAKWKDIAQLYGIIGDSQASQLQIINPGMGKGNNRRKASGVSEGVGLSGFWIIEYLKFVGFFETGLPRNIKEKSDQHGEDRKMYILRPRELSWETHYKIFPEFQKALYTYTAIQMDVLAILRYCQVFLRQWREGQGTKWGKFTKGNPGDHVAALDVVYYKKLKAFVVMNIGTLVLPEWMTVRTKEDAEKLSEVLEEHEVIIRNFREENSDEFPLLRTYRDFLSARNLNTFFEFTRGHAKHVMSQLNAGGRPRQFTTPNLEVLIMAHQKNLKPILENEGFLRIASAIRSSTVTPQYFKAIGQTGPYEIRYGLGEKLLRDASYPKKFIQALSKFIQAYMRETAQINERYKGKPPVRRPLVRVTDIDAIVELMDKFDSETVANLLIAYGYAHDPKSPTAEELSDRIANPIDK